MSEGKKQRVHVITMGCAKNVVDSEKLMAQLKLNDIEMASSLEDADIAIINTCGFIDAAKQESIDMILQNVQMKGNGRLKRVYAMGCLTERYREELIKEIPEVDRYFGSNRIQDVVEELGGSLKYELLGERLLTTPRHFAYLKISEGCDNPCSFCAIPIMRGKHVSRSIEDVVAEATMLAQRGVRELIVIGQDTTYYGLDLYGSRRLGELLDRLADIEGIEWLRLMYAYPAKFPLELLGTMSRNPRICKYIDIPIQHVADGVLKSMRRGISGRALRELLWRIRERVPGIAIRTTLIVGYPSESEEEFHELIDFVKEFRFNRLGVFTYSQEDETTAYPLGDPLPADEKERRRAAVMEAQQAIAEEENEALIGTRQRVMIDSFQDGVYAGRTERDAPEIDNEVLVNTPEHLEIGSFYDIDIVDASEYDLYGRR